ncbi:hypothetical protein [Nocardioides alkalitolerans]|uniref:hypothetical protein n=1 Tax=Nocardioides alkalitolerans TaxID=281714 RepID=UPI0003FFED5C|nr:hypothetical protein [Nocardioides alkalitolerans]
MPRLVRETFGAGDTSWLDSAHGIANCRTELLDISAFTPATHYPNGYIPSGTPVAKVAGLLVPYTSAEATVAGAGVLTGHLFTDQRVVGTQDFAVPVLDHGRVKAAKVPQGTDAFTAPVAAAKRAAVTINYR